MPTIDIQEKIEKKYLRDDKKRTQRMKVSGKSVFRLKKIINAKSRVRSSPR